MKISDIADRNAFSMAQKSYDSREPAGDPLTEGEEDFLEELEPILVEIDNLGRSALRQKDSEDLEKAYRILDALATRLATRRDE
ncbi:MAG: hypothetical protein ACYDBI_05965 [Thermoplasmataceae archaeon]